MTELVIKLTQKFPFFSKNLIQEIAKYGVVKNIENKTTILTTGDNVRMLPVVLDGIIKVYSIYEDKEFLLYYLKSSESCIMSFSACIENKKSEITAITESDSTLILLPSEKVKFWLKKYESFNKLFFKLYDQRYLDMINTLNHILFENIENRLLRYLYETRRIKGTSELAIKHREVAEDLGTAREVISRLLKKLEKDKIITQLKGGIIKIL